MYICILILITGDQSGQEVHGEASGLAVSLIEVRQKTPSGVPRNARGGGSRRRRSNVVVVFVDHVQRLPLHDDGRGVNRSDVDDGVQTTKELLDRFIADVRVPLAGMLNGRDEEVARLHLPIGALLLHPERVPVEKAERVGHGPPRSAEIVDDDAGVGVVSVPPFGGVLLHVDVLLVEQLVGLKVSLEGFSSPSVAEEDGHVVVEVWVPCCFVVGQNLFGEFDGLVVGAAGVDDGAHALFLGQGDGVDDIAAGALLLLVADLAEVSFFLAVGDCLILRAFSGLEMRTGETRPLFDLGERVRPVQLHVALKVEGARLARLFADYDVISAFLPVVVGEDPFFITLLRVVESEDPAPRTRHFLFQQACCTFLCPIGLRAQRPRGILPNGLTNYPKTRPAGGVENQGYRVWRPWDRGIRTCAIFALDKLATLDFQTVVWVLKLWLGPQLRALGPLVTRTRALGAPKGPPRAPISLKR